MAKSGLALRKGATEEQYLWFSNLAQRAYECTFCPRMTRHSAVLGPLNGRLEARVMVIGEAPGRFGSAVTRIPFSGDRSGINFEKLLPYAGLKREGLFITSAALCNPRDDKGRNDRPATKELHNCSGYLREMLDIVKPPYVVTLGIRALDALNLIEPHEITLKKDVGTSIPWRGTRVVPLYHPSGRVMAHRPLEKQAKDYESLGRILKNDPEGEWPGRFTGNLQGI